MTQRNIPEHLPDPLWQLVCPRCGVIPHLFSAEDGGIQVDGVWEEFHGGSRECPQRFTGGL